MGRLPGKALHVGVALWFRIGIEKRKEVKITRATYGSLGVTRYAANRALAKMEKAGLVVVSRACGRAPVVTVLVPGTREEA